MARTTPAVATPRVKVITPKGVTKANRTDLPADFLADVKVMVAEDKATGADLARLMVEHDLLDGSGNFGLRLRSYMRSHGAHVGRGRTYGMTFAEARDIAAGYTGKVAPPKGVRYVKGQAIQVA